ncbi:MAG TPA: type II toxin-antitoxin system PemK/MazF family toxin [Phenylobacterium sp.]|nr:type II toxin-antitoxin system PemK/MazF family toxin [Phenylobacterium sp.]
MKRGEVWWVELDPTRGSEIRKTRPCIILSVDQVNRARKTVTVVPLSSAPRAYPPISTPVSVNGQPSIAKCDQMRAVDKSRLKSRLGALAPEHLGSVEEAIREVLGL